MPKSQESKTVTFSAEEFNTGIPFDTVPSAELARMDQIQDHMLSAGFDLTNIQLKVGRMVRDQRGGMDKASELCSKLHDAACVLFLQWADARILGDKTTEYATARLFNSITQAARNLDRSYCIFDRSAISRLADDLKRDIADEMSRRASDLKFVYDPRGLAPAIDRAAKSYSHENSWAWVVLATFPRQHYGRILLDSVKIEGTTHFAMIIQSTFNDGEATLFHTHGQNWGFSRPLGPEGSNRHTNTMWRPFSEDKIFPLRQSAPGNGGKLDYSAGQVVIIPTRSVHGISGARRSIPHMSIGNFSSLGEDQRKAAISSARFGETSCLHVYRMDMSLSEEFRLSPLELSPGRSERDFFELNDMVVLDHSAGKTWSGKGGAWELRMLRYGPSGSHCGICFREDDPRREDLPDELVLGRLIDRSYPEPILMG